MSYLQKLEAHNAQQQSADPRLAQRPYYHLSMDELLEAIELKRNAAIRRDLIAELYARERR